jgi:hypothetical protein
VADARSKVTLRPRSKLERIVESLASSYSVPGRPALDVLSQLTLSYLVESTADGKVALSALSPLCNAQGNVDGKKLADAPRELVAKVCEERLVDNTLACLHATGELECRYREGRSPDRRAGDGRMLGGLEELCRGELGEARRMLGMLPGMSPWRVDFILLSSGSHALVAPTMGGMRVAARLGYPGSGYESLARALDAEIPPDALDIAWQAHHLFDQHAKHACAGTEPRCGDCGVRETCGFRGIGADPAARLPTGR